MPDTSTKRTWKTLAHEAIYDAGEWKRQCREFQVLNADLLAALKLAVKCIDYCRAHHPDAQSGTGFPVEIELRAAIAKAEGR